MPGFQKKTLVVTPISGYNFCQTLGSCYERTTNGRYSIPCNDCDNEYIGQTKRQFGTRLKEHQKAVLILLQ